MPVSLYAGKTKFSIAFFWDNRFLGAGKVVGSEVVKSLKMKGIDQKIEFDIKTSFTCEEALGGPDFDGEDD